MTHVLILQGTQTGAAEPRDLFLARVVNQQAFGHQTLQYVARRSLALQRVVNAQTFGTLTLNHIIVRPLTLARVANVNTFGGLELNLIPFVATNAELTALLAVFDGTYTTTDKLQMDTLISALKSAGVWSKLDWYGNAHWAKTEHDALLDWTDPSRSLVKVGSASWTAGLGLTGVNPMSSNSRYKSGWNIGSGPHSTSTSFCMFVYIDSIDVPQNGMRPMGVWRMVIAGPTTPDGLFLELSILGNTGYAGGNLQSGNGNTNFLVGDGLGLWATSRNAGTNFTQHNATVVDTDAVTGTSGYTDPDGISVAGSAGGAKRSFPGTQTYWGWGATLTTAEINGIQSAYAASLLPPSVVTNALLINDDNDYLADENGDYILVDGP